MLLPSKPTSNTLDSDRCRLLRQILPSSSTLSLMIKAMLKSAKHIFCVSISLMLQFTDQHIRITFCLIFYSGQEANFLLVTVINYDYHGWALIRWLNIQPCCSFKGCCYPSWAAFEWFTYQMTV